jgi:hypothetical protein
MGTPASFDYREFDKHDTFDRRCACGEVVVCAARHAALVAAARDLIDRGFLDSDYLGEECHWCGAWKHSRTPIRHDVDCEWDSLRAALDGERVVTILAFLAEKAEREADR